MNDSSPEQEPRRTGGAMPPADSASSPPTLPHAPSTAHQRPVEGLSTIAWQGPVTDTSLSAGSHDARRASPAAASPPLTCFGNYELLHEIARGGMGIVYRARQVKLDRIVALKMILAGELADPQHVQRFYAEAQAAALLQHPHIVPIFEVGEHEGRHYFSMGLIEGESLAQRLRRSPLAPRDAAQMSVVIAQAVQAAHEQGIVHRDLKPANILLDQQNAPHVTDFGLARRLQDASRLTMSGQIMGTPSYMAPEQAAGQGDQIDARSDVYALGAILYEMLTGRPPFQGSNPVETLKLVLEQDVVPPSRLNPSIDRDLETLCLKCLAKERGQRFGSAREFAEELQRFLAGEPIRSRRLGLVARGWRWCKRKPLVAGFGAAVTCAVLALGVAVALQSQIERTRRAAQLRTSIETELGDPELAPRFLERLENSIEALASFDPREAAAARERLYARYQSTIAEALGRPRLDDAQLRDISLAIDALAKQQPHAAKELRQRWTQRTSAWQVVAELTPPFDSLHTTFSADQVRITEQGVECLKPASPNPQTPTETDQRLLTNVASEAHAEFEVEFSARWQEAHRVGIGLTNAAGEGYWFVVRLPESSEQAIEDSATAPRAVSSFTDARRTNAQAVVEILKQGAAVQQLSIPLADLPAEALRLRATRRGASFEFQVQQREPVEFHDLFATQPGDNSRFSLDWPRMAQLTSLRARVRRGAEAPGPLEEADRWFDDQRFSDALLRYREQSETDDPEVVTIARLKAALCLLELRRESEAVPLLEQAAQSRDEQLAIIAASRLWQLHIEQQEFDAADRDFEVVRKRYNFTQLAATLPVASRRRILDAYLEGLRKSSRDVDPTVQLARIRQVIAVDRLLSPDGRGNHSLLYTFAKQLEGNLDGEAVLPLWEELFQRFPERGDHAFRYSRLLRASGQADKAVTILGQSEKLMREAGAEIPWEVRLERVRALATLQDWPRTRITVEGLFSQLEKEKGLLVDARRWQLLSHLYLMRGFAEEHLEMPEAARETWRKGYEAVRPGIGKLNATTDWSMINLLIMGALSDTVTDNDIVAMLNAVTPVARFALPQLGKDDVVAALRQMWRTPRGRQFAEVGYAWQLPTSQERVRQTIQLAVFQFAVRTAFDDLPLAEQEAATWEVAGGFVELLVGQADLRLERVAAELPTLLQFTISWRGQLESWQASLERLPARVHADTFYLLGHRAAALEKTELVRDFFARAARQSGVSPARLAAIEKDAALWQAEQGWLLVENPLGQPARLRLTQQGKSQEFTVDAAAATLAIGVGDYEVVVTASDGVLAPVAEPKSLQVRRGRATRITLRHRWQPDNSRTPLPGLITAPARMPDGGRWQMCLKFPASSARSLTISPGGKLAAFGATDGLVRVVDCETGEPLVILVGHANEITSLAFAPDGKTLASTSRDRTMRIWEIPSGRSLQVSQESFGSPATVWSPDGERIVAAGWDGALRVWNRKGELQANVREHPVVIFSASWRPAGTLLATASYDRTVRLWQMDETPTVVHKWTLAGAPRGVAWSPDGQWLAAFMDDQLILWSASTRQEHRRWKLAGNNIHALAWRPDSQALVTSHSNSTLSVWEVNASTETPARVVSAGTQNSLVWDTTSGRLASADWNGIVRFWTSDLRIEKSFGEPSRTVTTLAWHPTRELVAITTHEKNARLWDAQSKDLRLLTGHTSVVHGAAWNPEGTRLATASSDQTVRIWDPDRLDAVTPPLSCKAVCTGVAWLSNESVAAIRQDNKVLRWPTTSAPPEESSSPPGAFGMPRVSRDGRLALVNETDKVWVLAPGAREFVPWPLQRDLARGPAWHPQATHLAAGWGTQVALFNSDGVTESFGKGHTGEVFVVAWNREGSRLASASYDGTVRFWDAQARLLDTSSSFGLPLRHVTWSPDGTRVAVAGEPSIVHIWDVTNKRVSETLVLLPDQHWLRVSPHGQILTPSPAAMAHVAYVVEAEDRSLTLLNFDEFQSRMGLTGTASAP